MSSRPFRATTISSRLCGIEEGRAHQNLDITINGRPRIVLPPGASIAIDIKGCMLKVLVTGSGGLIGSACVEMLAGQGWNVVGVDNDSRRVFFGDAGSTASMVEYLRSTVPRYRHSSLDIRDRQGIRDLV